MEELALRAQNGDADKYIRQDILHIKKNHRTLNKRWEKWE